MLFVARSHYRYEGVAVTPALLVMSSLTIIQLVPLWGALPLLIYVEGAVYMTSPSWIRITLLQVES